MKAFIVSTDFSDGSVLVFAESTSKAKSIGQFSPFMEGAEWVDLKVRREPRADKYAGTIEGELCLDNAEGISILRDLGWHQIDGSSDVCNECERYQWDDLPESILHDTEELDVFICAECKLEKQKA